MLQTLVEVVGAHSLQGPGRAGRVWGRMLHSVLTPFEHGSRFGVACFCAGSIAQLLDRSISQRSTPGLRARKVGRLLRL